MSKQTSKKKKKKSFLIKIGRAIYNFLYGIYKVIDRYIITPITKVMLFITKIFKTSNKPFERLLHNKLFLITISLVLALLAFYINDNDANILMNNSAEVLYNQKITALYNKESYVIEGLPETVDITLIGRRSDLYLAKQYPTDEVVIDLRNLKQGTHTVPLKYNGSVSSVQYKLDPSTATVVVYEKISESRSIAKEILNENKLDSKYNITNVTFSRDDVYVKGAQYKVDKVAVVKALLDVKKIVNPTTGTTTLKDIPLVAYDDDGNKLDVELVPSKIDAKVEIDSPSKVVPITVIPDGNVVFGKSIDKIELSTKEVTIYGEKDALAKINSLPVKVDVEGIDKTTSYDLNLSKPSGVKTLSVQTINVRLTLGDTKEKKIESVKISTKNLGEGLKAEAATKTDSFITVIIKGTENNIKSITKDNIAASVDLQGLGVGIHSVKVSVTGDDLKLSYTPAVTTIKIKITK